MHATASPSKPAVTSSFSPINSPHIHLSCSSVPNSISHPTLVPSNVNIPLSAPSNPTGPLSSNVVIPQRPKPGRKADPNPAKTAKQQSNRNAARKHRTTKRVKKDAECDAKKAEYERYKELLRAQALKVHNRKRPHPEEFPHQDTPTTDTLSSVTVGSSSDSPPALVPAPGGCGKCVEGGSCPCVDSLIETDDTKETKISIPLEQLSVSSPQSNVKDKSRSAPLVIQSLLNPASPNSKPKSHKSSGGSQSELEIDFTKAFRNDFHYDPVMTNAAPNSCGACPPDDKGNCLCRKASHAATNDVDSNTSSPLSSRATSSAPGGPGSCTRCQVDPLQRAWCQSLARQTPMSPTSSSDPRESEAKRPRQHYETISCAEAYDVHQRFSNKSARVEPSPVSADEVLKSVRERPREYSAFEVDIGTVLSNLRHYGSRRSSTD